VCKVNQSFILSLYFVVRIDWFIYLYIIIIIINIMYDTLISQTHTYCMPKFVMLILFCFCVLLSLSLSLTVICTHTDSQLCVRAASVCVCVCVCVCACVYIFISSHLTRAVVSSFNRRFLFINKNQFYKTHTCIHTYIHSFI